MKPRCKTLGLLNHTCLRAELRKASWRHTRLGWEGNIHNSPHLLQPEHHEHTQHELYTIWCRNINKEGGWWLKLNGGSPADEKSERSTIILPSLRTTKKTIRCFQVDLQVFYFLSFWLFCSAFCKTYWIIPILLLNCMVIKNTLVYRWWTGSKFRCWFTHHNLRTNTAKSYESNRFSLIISF